MADSDFSVENLRLPADFGVPAKTVEPKPRRQKRDDLFVQISLKQLAILREGRAHASAWSVFADLVRLSWEEGGKPFKYSREAMCEVSTSHDSGARAIHTLAKLGLISFTQPTVRSSFVVTVHKL